MLISTEGFQTGSRDLGAETLKALAHVLVDSLEPWRLRELLTTGSGLVFGAGLLQTSVAETTEETETRFDELARVWEAETAFLSSPREIALHWAYQRIIGMGPTAVPLVLKRMQASGGHWFWALHALTGEDPARGLALVSEARAAWLRWGLENGYL